MLAVALAATIAGAKSFVAIAEWAADASAQALAGLGISGAVPSESTIRRCLQQLAPDRLNLVIAAWMWWRPIRRVDAYDPAE